MKSRRQFLADSATAISMMLSAGWLRAAGNWVGGMRTCKIPGTDLTVSRMGFGCAGLVRWTKGAVSAAELEDVGRLVHAAYDNGISLYDHAELYGFGRCEEVFGEVLTRSPGLRDK